jgi:hypothetical protein
METMKMIYKDKHGEEQTNINNNGETLSLVLRGVTFQGSDFDGLEPVGSYEPEQLSSFTFAMGDLCDCTLDVEIPITIATRELHAEEAGVALRESTAEGLLRAHIDLGSPTPKGGITHEALQLSILLKEKTFVSQGRSGWFEDELLELQRQLPAGTYLKICFQCAFSDYSPFGHGLFGGLACFRGQKQKYQAIQKKQQLLELWESMTEFVQETHLCPEFERRRPNTGYRG